MSVPKPPQRLHPPRGALEHVRVWTRIAGLLAWTGVTYSLFAIPAVITARSPRWRRRVNGWTQRTWARGLLRVLGVRRTHRGTPPPAPYFMVANHLSYLDILVLGAELGTVFVSKLELGTWPLMGHLSKVTGTIFIDRGRPRDAVRVMGEIDAAFAAGAGVLVFPEGTSSAGEGILPLKSALLEWAVRHRQPVHVATLRYTSAVPGRPTSEAVCWWGDDTPFVDHFLGLAALPAVTAEVVYVPTPVTAEDRTTLAQELHARLAQHFQPITE